MALGIAPGVASESEAVWLEKMGEGGSGSFVEGAEAHVGLVPDIGGGGAELLVVPVEVGFDRLTGGRGVRGMGDDAREDGVHVGEEGGVVGAPEGGGDAIRAELESIGPEGEVTAGLGPVAKLVDEDPVVGVGFELGASGFGGCGGADDSEENGGLFGGELGPVGGGEGVGVALVVAEGGDVVDDDGWEGDGAEEAGGSGVVGEGVAEAGELGLQGGEVWRGSRRGGRGRCGLGRGEAGCGEQAKDGERVGGHATRVYGGEGAFQEGTAGRVRIHESGGWRSGGGYGERKGLSDRSAWVGVGWVTAPLRSGRSCPDSSRARPDHPEPAPPGREPSGAVGLRYLLRQIPRTPGVVNCSHSAADARGASRTSV